MRLARGPLATRSRPARDRSVPPPGPGTVKGWISVCVVVIMFS